MISVLIVFTVVQGVQDIILTPTIMGKRTGLRPATILFSVFIWGKLLGLLGVILAIPLTCLTKTYFAKFILKENPGPVKKES
jgi:predicted PurR-regulated permease PerM